MITIEHIQIFSNVELLRQSLNASKLQWHHPGANLRLHVYIPVLYHCTTLYYTLTNFPWLTNKNGAMKSCICETFRSKDMALLIFKDSYLQQKLIKFILKYYSVFSCQWRGEGWLCLYHCRTFSTVTLLDEGNLCHCWKSSTVTMVALIRHWNSFLDLY